MELYAIIGVAALVGALLQYGAMRMIARISRSRGQVEGEMKGEVERAEEAQEQAEELSAPLELDPADFGSRWKLMRESRKKK